MIETILALNAGSTSLKFSLFAIARDTDSLSQLYRGGIEGIDGETRFIVYNAMGQRQEDKQLIAKVPISHEDALHVLLEWLDMLWLPVCSAPVTAQAHRMLCVPADYQHGL